WSDFTVTNNSKGSKIMMNQNRLLTIAASLIMVFFLSACQATKKTGITTEQNVVDEFADQVQIVDAGPADGSTSADEAARIQKELEEREAAKRAKAEADAAKAEADAARAEADAARAEQERLRKEQEARRAADEEAKRVAEQEAKRIAEENALTVKEDTSSRGVVNDAVPAGVPAYSVYFDFDKSSILPRFEEAVLAHADYLRANSQLRVEIQGNCDERGSREYNISLGNRRALAVKKALELLGIDGSRIDVTSYGSEKPRAMGHNENAWQENRRADFVY
ncbi:MAG: peptidoglycan-associated lipoprotein Pal, partial [Betaproteobacteria bacterium]